MNCESMASDTEDASYPRHVADSASAKLHDAVHALAQPLTALAFLLELGRIQTDPGVWRNALDDASTECRRAFQFLEEVREAVHALDSSGGWRQ